jgi:hypothetical protein
VSGADDQRLQDGSRRELSWSSLIRVPALVLTILAVVTVVLVVRSCSTLTVGNDTGAGFVGVELRSDCSELVRAEAGDTEEGALTRLNERPISIAADGRTNIGLVTNAVSRPTRFFLAYQIGDRPPAVREFDIDELEQSPVQVIVTADCTADFPEP